jgi:hypothetical protein
MNQNVDHVEDLHSHSCKKYCLYIVTTYGLFLQLCLRNHRAPNLSEVTYWLCLVASFTVLVTVNNVVNHLNY